MQTLILTDRSSMVTHLQCNRAGWWNRHFQVDQSDENEDGSNTLATLHSNSNKSVSVTGGLQRVERGLYFLVGTAMHQLIQMLMSQPPELPFKQLLTKLNEILHNNFGQDNHRETWKAEESDTKLEDALKEQRDLCEALALAWLRSRREHWQAEYRVAAIEPEINVVLFENKDYKVVLQSRPDVIAERISDGALLQWELKSPKSITKNWVDGWEHNLQLIGQQLAVKQWAKDNGRDPSKVVGACVEALLKGRRERDRDGGGYRQQTPLIYAYVQRGDGLLFGDTLSPTWKRNAKKELVSKYRPLAEWVLNDLPLEDVATKCIVVPPIQPSEWEVREAVEQWAMMAIANHQHARIVHEAIKNDDLPNVWLNGGFPQNTEHCFRYGKCPFFELCWNPSVAEDPLGSGIYQPRRVNHPTMEEEL